MASTQEIQKFSPEQLEKLANNPQNTVYEYKERQPLPQSKIVPLVLVRDKIIRLRLAYLNERKTQNAETYTYQDNTNIRKKLCTTLEWKRFDFTHPLIFDMVTGMNTSKSDMEFLLTMLRLCFNPRAGPKDVHNLLTKHRQRLE